MLTRCPTCQTLYQIDDATLQQADGQARCCRCDSVFDAREHVAEEDAGPSGRDEAAPLELTATDLPPDRIEPALADIDEDWTTPEALGDDEDVLNLAAISPDAAPVEPDEALPFDIPEDLPELQPAESESPSTEQVPDSPAHHSRLQDLAAVLLVLTALAQIAWQHRDEVLATPIGHTLGESLCSLAGCRLPPQRAPSRFALMERNIGPAPDRQETLAMQLSFRNTADFAQPLPDIQLSLYDSEERLMARRRLHPEEYLFPAPGSGFLVEQGGLVQVNLQLEDPGRKAVGFRIEFL